MKFSTRILVPFVLVATAGLAMAQEAVPDLPTASTSSLSRATVLAEARTAQAAGLIAHGEVLPVQAERGVGKTRDQVRAEYSEARRLGLVGTGEILPIATPEQAEQIRMAGVRATQFVQK